MQSIHNDMLSGNKKISTVCDISKIRNVVNSQRLRAKRCRTPYCLRYIKDTKCSQFTTGTSAVRMSCELFAIYQRYEMQSIHNVKGKVNLRQLTVCDISKIRNVVNSQPRRRNTSFQQNCLRYIKDTKCSQFTTISFALN